VGLFKIKTMVGYNSIADIQFLDNNITEPVTLTEAKDFCKIDISTDDTLILSLITAARQYCEAYTGVGFVDHHVVATMNNTNGNIYFPYCPNFDLISIEDREGNALVIDQTYKIYGNAFKYLEHPREEGIVAEYTCGYAPGTLPDVLKTALLNQIYFMYDNRAQNVDGISPISKMLLNPYRRV
jgi:uncharacterized phiE125 gp8 family phage protein